MKSIIKLEAIGDDFYFNKNKMEFREYLRYMQKLGPDKSKSDVFRVTDYKNDFIYKRLKPIREYSEANSIGSRGIYLYYIVDDGPYFVVDRYQWNKVRKYFVIANNGVITEITKNEAIEWLTKNTLAKTS